MNGESYDRAVEADMFSAPLRNIRASLDGTTMAIDLIPSVILESPTESIDLSGDGNVDEVLSKMLKRGRPIVEGDRVFRVYFESVQACVVQEEFVELFAELDLASQQYPTFGNNKACFPFLRIDNSKWRNGLPDYQGGDCPELRHYKVVSMETCVDVLGIMSGSEWIRNSDAAN